MHFFSQSKITLILFCIASILLLYRIFRLWNHFLPDFDVFYFASRELVQQHNPYQSKELFTIFNYPIITLFFYLPFLLFPFIIAGNILTIINLLALICIVFVSLRILNILSLKFFLIASILSFISFPVNFTLGMGQSNLIAYA